jgi:hypothetical protein
MNIGAVTIMIIVMVVVTLLFAWGLQRTYMDKLENSKLTSVVAVGALSVTLLCVLLIRTWKRGAQQWLSSASTGSPAFCRVSSSHSYLLSFSVALLRFALLCCCCAL